MGTDAKTAWGKSLNQVACSLGCSCLGQVRKILTETRCKDTFLTILGIWLLARLLFFCIVHGFYTSLSSPFPHLRLRSVQSPEGKSGWKQNTHVGGNCEYYCEAGIIKSDPWWSLSSSYESVGKRETWFSCKQQLNIHSGGWKVSRVWGGIRHDFAIRKLHIVSTDRRNTHPKVQKVCLVPLSDADHRLSTEDI